MQFSEEYFKAEERAGFYISSLMKRAWACQLDILEQIDIICKRHAISYFADWGTMLGAIREQGYIAWDDDLDIGMLRRDYEKFRYYADTELPKEYRMENDRIGRMGEEADDVIVHVRNNNGVCTEPQYLESHHGCPYVLCVDIFVYDNISDDKREREYYTGVYNIIFNVAENLEATSLLQDCNENEQELLIKISDLTGKMIEREYPVKQQLYALLDYVAAVHYNDTTQEVAIMGYYKDDVSCSIPRKWVEETVERFFEGRTIPVPKAFHRILEQRYGEYMIPRKGVGADHPYPYFGSQIKRLNDVYQKKGLEIPREFLE